MQQGMLYHGLASAAAPNAPGEGTGAAPAGHDLMRGVDINQLENEADHVMRKGMSKLFRDDLDFKELIKLKEIYEILESVTDRCEDVANIVESIVLDHA